MAASQLVVVSNRGPVSFARDGGGALVARRGGGGLISLVAPAIAETDAIWVAGAMSDDDRSAAAAGLSEVEGFRLAPVVVEVEEYRQYYDVIANATLWFCHHGLFDLPRRPRFDRRWHTAWDAYVAVNERFAAAAARVAAEGAVVLVQDYHLGLVGAFLGASRPDTSTCYFHHTPFGAPHELAVLPDAVGTQLLDGLGAFGARGFHAARWGEAYEACGGKGDYFVSPAASDPDALAATVASPAAQRARRELDELIGDRLFLVRVDRMELSKNIARGFLAFEEALASRPDLRGRVVFGAFCYPSREGLADYQAYRQEIETLAERVNDRWATPDWTPILLDSRDDYPASVAALARADAVLVNPVRDGLNLVAKEAMLVNDRAAALILSQQAGVWDELGAHGALGLNPFDISATAAAIATACSMPQSERAGRAERLRAAAGRRRPGDWLGDQLAAAGRG